MRLLPFLAAITTIHLLICRGATPPSAHIIVDGSIYSLVDNFVTPSECTFDTEHVGLEENPEGINIGVGCCNDDVPPLGSRPDCLYPATYKKALAHCQSQHPSLRLCTKHEILAGAGDSTGCMFDHFHLWTSTECVASHYTVDGSSGNAPVIPDECHFDNERVSIFPGIVNEIGVTCCDNGAHVTGSRPDCLSGVTYGEAFRHCQDQVPSLRLCTMAEIEAGAGVGSGCQFDSRHNWVIDVCVATYSPTADPTNYPTFAPTLHPTFIPTSYPTSDPTIDPTFDPTKDPTADPTFEPTFEPTIDPTNEPTFDPTKDPTIDPTLDPTSDPTSDPTIDPTFDPTKAPTKNPTNSSMKSTQMSIITHSNHKVMDEYKALIIILCISLVLICSVCIVYYKKANQIKMETLNVGKDNNNYVQLPDVIVTGKHVENRKILNANVHAPPIDLMNDDDTTSRKDTDDDIYQHALPNEAV